MAVYDAIEAFRSVTVTGFRLVCFLLLTLPYIVLPYLTLPFFGLPYITSLVHLALIIISL